MEERINNNNIQEYSVCIFTECGAEYGYGHIVRCISLFDEFKLRGLRPLLVINCNENDKDLFYNKNYIIDKLWYEKPEKYLLRKPLSVIDSYVANDSTYKKICNCSIYSIYIDDTNRIEYPSGTIVNPSIIGDKLSYKRRSNQTLLVGANYVILRKEFNDKQQRKTYKEIKNILITTGGSDIKNLTPIILKNIIEKQSESKILHIIIGKGFKNLLEINRFKANNVNLYFNLDAEYLKKLMGKCDIAISTAGQTTNELIATQLPFICIKIADNQKNNILGLQEYRLIENYIDCTNSSFDEVMFNYLYKEIQDFYIRKDITSRMANLDLNNGTKNIIDMIIPFLNERRA